MSQEVIISPSLLSADFMKMEAEIQMVEKAGAGFVHVDVMDGHFVPNLTMGVPFVQCLKAATRLPLDVHLMIANPLQQIPWFLKAGADWITVHIETVDEDAGEVSKAISMIREGGAHPGLAIKPKTPVQALEPYINQVDMVLVMSVEPGFSGQSFIDGSNQRIEEVAKMAKETSPELLIQVDGGIDASTIEEAVHAGARVLVAGNAIFAQPNPEEALVRLKQIASSSTQEKLLSEKGN